MALEQDTPNLPPDHHKRNLLLTEAAIVFLLLGIIWLAYWAFYGRFYENTDDAYVNGNLVQIMPQISGQVTSIRADETDLVTKGEWVVSLDKADAVIALQMAEEQLAQTVRQVDQLYQNINQLKANVVVQQDNLERVQEDYKRRSELVVNKVISREELQHAKLTADSAVASLALAQAQLDAQVALVSNSDLYHHPQVLAAATQLRNAYLAWRRTTIYAPETGYIAKRPVQVGEQVTPNTVLMVMVPLNQIWVDANYKESQLKNIRIGQPVEVTADAYGNGIKFKGTVIGLNPGTGSTFDLLPPQNATGNWIKIVQRLPVRIAIDPEQLKKYPLRLGLSVTVNIDSHNRNGATLTQLPQAKIIYQTKDYSTDLQQVNDLINKILQANAKNVSYP